MKTIHLLILLMTSNSFAQAEIDSIQMEELNLEGHLPKKTMSEKLIEKRRRLEKRNTQKIQMMIEFYRVENERKLMLKTEQAMKAVNESIPM